MRPSGLRGKGRVRAPGVVGESPRGGGGGGGLRNEFRTGVLRAFSAHARDAAECPLSVGLLPNVHICFMALVGSTFAKKVRGERLPPLHTAPHRNTA